MKTFNYAFFMFVLLSSIVRAPGFAEAQPSGIIVPNVQGIPSDVAAQLLRTAGLEPNVRHETRDSSIVISQEPKPGMLLPAGGEVIISTGILPSQAFSTTQAVRERSSLSDPVSGRTTSEDSQPMHTLELSQPSSTVSNTAITQSQTSMAWYPKQFLAAEQPEPRFFWIQSEHAQTPNILNVRPLTSRKGISILLTTPGWQNGWFWSSPQATQIPSSPTNDQTRIMGGQGTISGTVSVPYVVRLPQSDAVYAIQKAGLAIGSITRAHDPQLKAGLVLEQSPRSSSIVAAGTQVHLWVVE